MQLTEAGMSLDHTVTKLSVSPIQRLNEMTYRHTITVIQYVRYVSILLYDDDFVLLCAF